MLAYIIASTFIVILLFSAVCLNLSFGLHRVIRPKAKVLPVARVPQLDDFLFRKY